MEIFAVNVLDLGSAMLGHKTKQDKIPGARSTAFWGLYPVQLVENCQVREKVFPLNSITIYGWSGHAFYRIFTMRLVERKIPDSYFIEVVRYGHV